MPASHPRRIIRNAIASRLATPLPDTSYWTPAEERVFSSKPTSIDPLELPCLVVRSIDETVEETGVTEFSTYRRRELRLSIDCMAEAYDQVEDLLDDMAVGVELALEGFAIPTQEEATITLDRTDIDTSLEGDVPMGAAKIQITVTYLSVYNGVDYGFQLGADAILDLNKDGDSDPGVCLDPLGVTNVSVEISNTYDPDDSPVVETITEE